MQFSGILSEQTGRAMSVETHVGIIRTVAGNGEPGLSGDGGAAVLACLNEPKSVTLDGWGNVIIADSENHVIRKIDRVKGTITTVAGFGGTLTLRSEVVNSDAVAPGSDDPFDEASVSGEGAFTQQTDLSGTVRYVVNGAGGVKRFGGDGGPADRALLNFPTAVTVDGAGNLFVADMMNHRVRRIDAVTGQIRTIAGIGQPRYGGDGGPAMAAGLNEPAAVAVSASGTLYIADQSNNRVRAVDLSTGIIHTVAGTGESAYNGDGMQATNASLAGPSGVAVGSDGTLYIADTFNGRIRAVNPATGVISTVVGDGGEYRYQGAVEPPSSSLSRPSGIAVDAEGNLFITDSDNHLIRRWDRATGRLDRLAGLGIANFGGDGGSALEASMNYPFGVAVGGDGRLFIADTFNHRIREIAL